MTNFLLFLIAWVLWLPLTFINYFLVKGDYFLSSAISLDRYANREFRTLWNKTLRLESMAEFGDIKDTISCVLGRIQIESFETKIFSLNLWYWYNKKYKIVYINYSKLTLLGNILCFLLDNIDKDHCKKSVKN
jgi:hypothetical protein